MAYKSNRGVINIHSPKEFTNDDGTISKVYPSNFNIEGIDYVGNAYPQLSNGLKILKITLKLKDNNFNIDEIL